MSNETPKSQQDGSSGDQYLVRNILANLLTTITSLPGISSIAVILSMVFVYIYAGGSEEGIASVNYARGMITLLFAVGTVVIALLLTLGAIFPTADDVKAKERFERGKEVLSLLIGIFGTIIGFYFGSIMEKSPQAVANNASQQIQEQVLAQKSLPQISTGSAPQGEQLATELSTTQP